MRGETYNIMSLQRWISNPPINYKILIYPNITHKHSDRDSYIQLLPYIIKYLNKLRKDLHFTLILREEIEALRFPNVTQKIMKFPKNPNTMRTHFDSDEVKKILNWKREDWDIIYSHLPEHTLQLVNLIYNSTHHRPKVIGYSHWFETKESMSNRERTMFLQNISGVLQMDEMGVNSIWLKDYVLDKCREFFNEDTIQKLDTIIQPHYLGAELFNDYQFAPFKLSPIVDGRDGVKKIIFNHRHNNYTGFNWFVKCMDKLWEERKDFKVYTTLGKLDREYACLLETSSKEEYLKELEGMYIGVGAFKKYSAWSLSTTDGFSRGIPYLLPNDLVYPEMLKTTAETKDINGDSWLEKDDEYHLFYENNEEGFLTKMREVLDDVSVRDVASKYVKGLLVDNFSWDDRIKKWFGGWNSLFDEDSYKQINEDAKSYQKVIEFISVNGYARKSEIYEMLGWGVTFQFSNIRNRLRTDDRIKLTESGYEWMEMIRY
jgi:glycosyltransferase involved in cell wall biosynthesis